MGHCSKVTEDNGCNDSQLSTLMQISQLAFDSLLVLSCQIFVEARFHASPRPHLRSLFGDSCGWSDCSHLQCPG